jgi:hypothetical protein
MRNLVLALFLQFSLWKLSFPAEKPLYLVLALEYMF